MLAHDLVDELHLLVYPLTLGGGKRVMPDGVFKKFTLLNAVPVPDRGGRVALSAALGMILACVANRYTARLSIVLKEVRCVISEHCV